MFLKSCMYLSILSMVFGITSKCAAAADIVWDEQTGWIKSISFGGKEFTKNSMPWRIIYADGKEVECPIISDKKSETPRVEFEKLTDGSVGAVTWTLKDIKVKIRISINGERILFFPTVWNFGQTPVQWVDAPIIKFPISKMVEAIEPWWGGVAFSKSFCVVNPSALEGTFPPATHDLGLYHFAKGWMGIYGADRTEPIRYAMHKVITAKSPKDWVLYHRFSCWIEKGQADMLPPTVLAWGASPFVIGDNYRMDSGIDYPRLKDKLEPELYNKLITSLHVDCMISEKRGQLKYEQWQEFLSSKELPDNLLIEFSGHVSPEYFDYYNPDSIPVCDSLGGTAKFPGLVDLARKRGMIVQSYVNTTWWNPNAPTYKRLNAEKVSLKLDWKNPDKIATEFYAASQGVRVQLWRPEVQERAYIMAQEFLKCNHHDILFHDQLGHTFWPNMAWDFDPKRPGKPYRYFQDILDLIAISTQYGPLSSEGVGNDRAYRYLAATFGHYFRVENNMDWGTQTLSRPWPYFQLATNGTIMFYPHNLQGCTSSDSLVSWQLALGIAMDERYNDYMQAMIEGKKGWGARLKLLALIQSKIASLYIGQKMTDYNYIGHGYADLTKTSWENGLEIYASHRNVPNEIDAAGSKWKLGPYGFLAVKDGKAIGGYVFEKDAAKPQYFIYDGANTIRMDSPLDINATEKRK